MKLKIKKRSLLTAILILLLSLNIFQYLKFKSYEKKQYEAADMELNLSLQTIYSSIKNMRTMDYDDEVKIAMISAGTSKAETIYPYTSYYKNNSYLNNTLWTLNNNITNRSNIKEVMSQNDFTLLLPALKKVMDNPNDINTTKDFDYIVRKYTVLGSLLP